MALTEGAFAVNRRLGLACLAALTLSAAPVQADVITSLFNTGEGDNRLGLLGNVIDPHWTVTNPDGTLSAAFTLADSVLAGRPYLAALADSRWIQPGSGVLNTAAAGTYTYSTVLNLQGFDPTQTQISFRVAADNRIAGVLLNGNPLGFTYDGPLHNGEAFTAFSDAFTISNPAFFRDGLNQLQFLVVNDPLPLGAGGNCYGPPENPTGMLL